jgi:hypothetical protein
VTQSILTLYAMAV